MKISVQEIADKVGVPSRDVVTAARDLGLEKVKTKSSKVDPLIASAIEKRLRPDPISANGSQTVRPKVSALQAIEADATSSAAPSSKTTGEELDSVSVAKESEAKQPGGAPLVITLRVAGTGSDAIFEGLKSGTIEIHVQAVSSSREISRTILRPSNAPTSSSLRKNPQDDRARKLLIQAYRASLGEEQDGAWIDLAKIGANAAKLTSGFSPLHYGAAKLGDLIRRFGDSFEVKTDDAKFPPVMFARRRKSQAEAASNIGQSCRGMIYNLKEGYGFIKPDDGVENIYFHHSEVEMPGFGSLRIGNHVGYTVSKNDKGLCALRVRLLDSLSPQ